MKTVFPCTLALFLAIGLSAPVRAQSGTDLGSLFARAASGDEAAELELVQIGAGAAEQALFEWATRSLPERRLRALVVERAGAASAVQPAILALSDSDALVRETLVRFLARPELGRSAVESRLAALARAARSDSDAAVRLAAATALSALDDDAAAAALAALVDECNGAERAAVAALLPTTARGRPFAYARLMRAAAGDEPGAVLAALLVPCARAAADDAQGFLEPALRAPIGIGLRHPDPRVRAAARLAVDAHIARRLARQDYGGAIEVLAAFERDGFDACRTLEERARIALLSGTRDDEALQYTRALDAASRSKDAAETPAWRARAAHLEALAWLAKGDTTAALAPLERAVRWIDALLAQRADLSDKDGAAAQVALLFERAGLAVTACARILALDLPLTATLASASGTATVAHAALLEMRAAHRYVLQALAVAWRAEVDAARSFDTVLQSNVGVHDLVIDVPRRAAWPPERALALRVALGRAFATVAPLEGLGFEPYIAADNEIIDPHADPVRRAWLIAALDAECDRSAREYSKARRAILREAYGGIEPEQLDEVMIAENRFQEAVDFRRRVEDGDWRGLADLRTPSWYVVWVGRALRDEGHPALARPFLTRARDQLDASEVAARYLWGPEMTAEVEMMLGGTYSDDGDPRRAELELSKAEKRLAALEEMLRENGASEATLAIVRNQRCGALVALAVNANVKLHDPKKAVEWFEAAWEIRQDDFMRVLLACYRAREGKTHAARALVREVTPSPGTYYNLACTWALLGDAETALAFLKRDLDENYPSAGGLRKQKEWARTDPDLESLRNDPRFLKLLESDR
ncbi:MAG: hypothetical protein JNL28_16100 [Planctomycetes bacterium]|nr:hypothetical protein [Planctomycetota bacterium]